MNKKFFLIFSLLVVFNCTRIFASKASVTPDSMTRREFVKALLDKTQYSRNPVTQKFHAMLSTGKLERIEQGPNDAEGWALYTVLCQLQIKKIDTILAERQKKPSNTAK